METALTQLTVYFDDPFWVGVFERHQDGGLEAARVVFGSEPKDSDVYRLVLDQYLTLAFSRPVAEARRENPIGNPKRRQRAAARCVAAAGAGTKAQQALKLQHEQTKQERKDRTRTEQEEEAEKRYQLRQEKRRQKHKGR